MPRRKLVFTTEPGGGAGGSSWTNQPVVSVEDSGGNVVTTATNSITLAIASGPTGAAPWPAPLTLRQRSTAWPPSPGVRSRARPAATPSDASATGGLTGTSTPFNITAGAASQLVFTTEPGGGANAAVWGAQPVVTVEDASGNVVTTATSSITLAITSGPAGAALGCTTNPKAAVNGVATFAGCEIAGTAGSYTLGASATGGLNGTSTSFAISVGAASQLAFTTEPGGGTNGGVWIAQPIVSVEDSGGNVVTTATNSITLAIASGPTGGGTLACTTNPKAAVNGVATFAGCEITGKTGPYTLRASATGLSGTSTPFNITAGAASQLVFTTEPGGGANAAMWGAQPVVTVEDASGNVVTTATSSITLAIASGPTGGGTLACTTNPKAAVNGVVTFAGCEITGKTGPYTLGASATGGLTGTSTQFNITAGAASQLVFTTEPGGGANAAMWGAQPVVTVEDASGNVVTTATSSITLAIASGPTGGGTLACTTNPKAAVNGVATFAGCEITGKTGPYTLERARLVG